MILVVNLIYKYLILLNTSYSTSQVVQVYYINAPLFILVFALEYTFAD
jgi:hypothetical protein